MFRFEWFFRLSFDFSIREDTVNGIVYFLDVFNQKILYNFNLHLGDTFHTYFHSLSFPVIDSVISIDSVLIGDYYYKKITVKELDTTYPHCLDCAGWDTIFTYMEGFGSLFRPVSNQPFGPALEYQEFLTCFRHHGIAPVVISISYFYPSLTDTLLFINDCTGVEVLEPPNPTKDFIVYPNPARDEITIEGAKDCDVRIFDMVGEIKSKVKSENQKVSIDISDLVRGVYMVEVADEETGMKVVRKVVKEL